VLEKPPFFPDIADFKPFCQEFFPASKKRVWGMPTLGGDLIRIPKTFFLLWT